MRLLRFGFIVSAMLPGLAAQSHPNIGIFMQFDAAPGAASVAAMEKEVAQLFQPSGLALSWRLTGDARNGEAFYRLAVVRFKGRCSAEISPSASQALPGEVRPLGATRVAEGHVLPYTEVRCDEVRKALAYLRPGANAVERQMALGRALGRVLAHELYHILANAKSHPSKGLARAVEPLPELIAPKTEGFQDTDWKAVAANLSQN